jgi:hypothetical protein
MKRAWRQESGALFQTRRFDRIDSLLRWCWCTTISSVRDADAAHVLTALISFIVVLGSLIL